jgi:hypothetical protein
MVVSLLSVIFFLLIGQSEHSKTSRNLVSLQHEQIDTTERYLWEGKAFLFGLRQLEKGVSLFLHCNISDLPLLENIMKLWPGKVSLCVYVHITQLYEKNLKHIQYYRDFYNKRVTITLYSSQDNYPVNILRNRAVQRVTTELALSSDIYTLPSPRLYDYIFTLNYEELEKKSNSVVYTLPVFISNLQIRSENIPDSKNDILRDINSGLLVDKLAQDNYSMMNGTSWFNINEMVKVESNAWKEPYLLVNLKHVPLFDERVTYREDPLQWNSHLSLLGYDFYILPEHFVIQFPKEFL